MPLAQTDTIGHRPYDQTRVLDRMPEDGHCCIDFCDLVSSIIGVEWCELSCHIPCLPAGKVNAEIDDRLIGSSGDPIQEPEHGPDFCQFLFDRIDKRSQDLVDPVEIFIEAFNGVSGSSLSSGDSEIQIDMGIDAEQQVLNDNCRPIVRRIERYSPRLGGLPAQR